MGIKLMKVPVDASATDIDWGIERIKLPESATA